MRVLRPHRSFASLAIAMACLMICLVGTLLELRAGENDNIPSGGHSLRTKKSITTGHSTQKIRSQSPSEDEWPSATKPGEKSPSGWWESDGLEAPAARGRQADPKVVSAKAESEKNAKKRVQTAEFAEANGSAWPPTSDGMPRNNRRRVRPASASDDEEEMLEAFPFEANEAEPELPAKPKSPPSKTPAPAPAPKTSNRQEETPADDSNPWSKQPLMDRELNGGETGPLLDEEDLKDLADSEPEMGEMPMQPDEKSQQPEGLGTPKNPKALKPADRRMADLTTEDLNNPLGDIIVEGNTTIRVDAILRHVKSRSGRPLSQSYINEDVAALINTRWFYQVQPVFRTTSRGLTLVFKVTERPILQSVEFKGNKKIKTGELQAQTGLTRGHAFDVSANRQSVAKIQALYKERGYQFAKVKLVKGGDANDRGVVVQIDEGNKVRVWSVKFEGHQFVSGAVLKTKLSTKTVILWKISGTYDPEVIKNDVSTLKEYYKSLGFFDVTCEFTEEFDDEKAYVTVHFKISEGTRYHVRKVEFVGNQVVPTDKLFQKPKMGEGAYFNARLLNEDLQKMRSQYNQLGRLFAKVDPQPRFLEEPGVIDLVYNIDEDKPYIVGQVNVHIRGDHPHTQLSVIENQVNRFVKPGFLANGDDIKLAEARVQGSQLWDKQEPARFDMKRTDGKFYLEAPNQALARAQEDGLSDNVLYANEFSEQVFPKTRSKTKPASQRSR